MLDLNALPPWLGQTLTILLWVAAAVLFGVGLTFGFVRHNERQGRRDQGLDR